MQHTVQWIEEPWLLLLISVGEFTLETRAAYDTIVLRYLDAANGNIYWVSDLRKTSIQLSPELLTAMLKSPVTAHPNCGLFAFIGKSAMLKFLTTAIVQRSEATQNSGSLLYIFDTLQEAEVYCRQVAAVDKRRATALSINVNPASDELPLTPGRPDTAENT